MSDGAVCSSRLDCNFEERSVYWEPGGLTAGQVTFVNRESIHCANQVLSILNSLNPAHIPVHNLVTIILILYSHLIVNCDYCNITLARNKAPWWWFEKTETCRSVLKCFMWNYMCIRRLINWSDSHPSFRPPNGITVLNWSEYLIVITYCNKNGTEV